MKPQHFIKKIKIYNQVLTDALRAIRLCLLSSRRDRYGYIADSATVLQPAIGNKGNIFLYEHTSIGEYSQFITSQGKFIMKKHSIASQRFTVITANHPFGSVGNYPGDEYWSDEIANDVIVDEEVWIGANVTLCPGVHIGRGAIVAAGSVCVKTKEYPPYTIIGGNPATVIKFKFDLATQIEHEIIRFTVNERIPIPELKESYNKFNKKRNMSQPFQQ